jgi:aminoglycoside phosphotransferase (APT) family kinase protein
MSTAPNRNDPDGRLTRPKLAAVLTAVCERAGLDPTDAQLIKFTNNAVFRLQREPVVVRIAGSATMRGRAAKIVSVAGWMRQQNLPAVRLLPNIEQPVQVGEHLATLWQLVPSVGPAPNGTALGHILRQLHGASAPPAQLPSWRPVESIRSRLADAEGLSVDDYAFLDQRCDEVEADLAGLRYILPPGFIHGDATVANLIPGPDGPVICDFDSAAIGPREWDLTPVAAGHLRFVTRADNQTPLVAAYGFDVTTWDGFPALRRLRELQLVTSVVPVLRSNPGLYEQWQHRLQTFREGDGGARWELYR